MTDNRKTACVLASENSTVIVNDGTLARNVGPGGTALFARENAGLKVSGTKILDNLADGYWGGGGIAVTDAASLILTGGALIKGNRAQGIHTGGALSANGETVTTITGNTTFASNVADGGGGAISTFDDSQIMITGGSRFVDNRVINGYGGGALSLNIASSITITGGSSFVNNTGDGSDGGAVAVYGNSTLKVAESSFVANKATTGGAIFASSSSTVTITNNSVFANNSAVIGADVNAQPLVTMSLAGSRLNAQSKSVFWLRKQCEVGEVLQHGYCQSCIPSTYSFDPSHHSCEICPINANCTGGDSLLPLTGYWHSSQYSTQIHRCPHVADVCEYNGTCAQGYTGHLCGSCGQGYGSLGPFNCGRCLPKRAQWQVYFATSFVSVLLVTYTVQVIWRGNRVGARAEAPAYYITILVKFIQYLVILGSMPAEWPSSLGFFYKVASLVFAASNNQVVSLDCVLGNAQGQGVPPAVLKQVIYLVAPFVVVAAVMVMHMLLWCIGRLLMMAKLSMCNRPFSSSLGGLGATLRSKLPVTCLVVLIYAYPFLLRASLGFFACYHIDDASNPADPYPQYAVANASQGYWVSSLGQPCWQGWHWAWALGFGLPVSLLLCLGVPLAIVALLRFNRGKLHDPAFKAHFGFLYRTFRDERCWWEGVWAAQTTILVALSVFRYNLGAYFSVVLVSYMFGVTAVLQLLFKPYALKKLHVMQLVGSVCLFTTAYIALSLFTVDVSTGGLYRQVVGAIAIVINLSFVLWCCYCIVWSSRGPMVLLCKGVCSCMTGGRSPVPISSSNGSIDKPPEESIPESSNDEKIPAGKSECTTVLVKPLDSFACGSSFGEPSPTATGSSTDNIEVSPGPASSLLGLPNASVPPMFLLRSLSSTQPLPQRSLNGALESAALDSTNMSGTLHQLPSV